MAFPRPLAVGAAGGAVGTALLGILHQAFLHEVHRELRSLQEVLAELTTRVADLTLRVEEGGSRSQASLGSFELCGASEAGESTVPVSVVSSESHRPIVNLPVASPAAPLNLEEVGGGQSWAEREAIAGRVGLFLARALAGNHPGSSGRHEIRADSHLYLVVRDHSGFVTTQPIRVLRNFSEVRRLCQVQNSVFVGLPTEQEGRICAAGAGFGWPSSS